MVRKREEREDIVVRGYVYFFWGECWKGTDGDGEGLGLG